MRLRELCVFARNGFCNWRFPAEQQLHYPPELIVEVLSPGTENRRRDEHAKRQLYKKYGVKEYWILDPQKLMVQVFRTARLKLTATLGVRDELIAPLLPGFRCSVKELFQQR